MADLLIDRLTADLAPARPRRPWLELSGLLGLAVVEAGAIVALGFARGDLEPDMGSMFWWKLLAPAVVAMVAAAMAVRAGDPSRVTPRAIGPVLLAMGVILLGVILAWTLPVGDYALGHGLACVMVAGVFASPPALALGLDPAPRCACGSRACGAARCDCGRRDRGRRCWRCTAPMTARSTRCCGTALRWRSPRRLQRCRWRAGRAGRASPLPAAAPLSLPPPGEGGLRGPATLPPSGGGTARSAGRGNAARPRSAARKHAPQQPIHPRHRVRLLQAGRMAHARRRHQI